MKGGKQSCPFPQGKILSLLFWSGNKSPSAPVETSLIFQSCLLSKHSCKDSPEQKLTMPLLKGFMFRNVKDPWRIVTQTHEALHWLFYTLSCQYFTLSWEYQLSTGCTYSQINTWNISLGIYVSICKYRYIYIYLVYHAGTLCLNMDIDIFYLSIDISVSIYIFKQSALHGIQVFYK